MHVIAAKASLRRGTPARVKTYARAAANPRRSRPIEGARRGFVAGERHSSCLGDLRRSDKRQGCRRSARAGCDHLQQERIPFDPLPPVKDQRDPRRLPCRDPRFGTAEFRDIADMVRTGGRLKGNGEGAMEVEAKGKVGSVPCARVFRSIRKMMIASPANLKRAPGLPQGTRGRPEY